MDSDSDSGGSHVSATPPREPFPQPRRPPPVPVASRKSRTSDKSSARLNITKTPPVEPIEKPSRPSLSDTASSRSVDVLPFQILNSSAQLRAVGNADSVESIPAGFFSTVPSFSRIRRASVTFETEETKSECRADGTDIISEPRRVVADPVKPVRMKHPNLIVADTPSPPVRVLKRSGGGSGNSEGNFVKLNLNGKRRKFHSKCQSTVKSRNSYKYKRRSSRKSRNFTGHENEPDEGITLQQPEQMGEEENGFSKSVEEAILAAKNEASDENLERLLDAVYGYESFRDGQLEAIKLVLEGNSTMLVLPTGAGKSLCYQIPAMILPGITLVVSPLVALMIDQLKHLPPIIRGGLLSSNQGPEETTETLRQLKEGLIKVLFVSPERFLNAGFMSMFSAALTVSFVVVDEAHCVSEWSHNFRPAYMRLKASLLCSQLNAKCILAMTATATTRTLQAVMSSLEIPSTNLVQKSHLRENLQLSVSLSGANRMKDLLLLMKSSPFQEIHSIIIYCKFQYETDMISKYLRDNNIAAKSYHSGLFAKDRSRVQDSFCSNKIRVVVATVAFGMGLDKRDVGAVIHYSLPGSLEEYVQEIGRAGRDGRSSYCHLFYDDNTYFKLRSLAHSDGVDEYVVSRFLAEIFSNEANQHGKICSLVKDSASRGFDMKQEVMETLLTHLELGEVQYLHLHSEVNVSCTLHFHKTPPGLLAERNSLVAAILKKSQTRQGRCVVDIPNLANSIGVTAAEVSTQLHNLKMKGEVTYEMKDPAFCYTIKKLPEDFNAFSVQLVRWLSEIEACKVRKLDAMSDAALSAADICKGTQCGSSTQQTQCLQKKISDYFHGDGDCPTPRNITQNCRFLRADMKVFLQSNQHAKFNPRAVARIMHGIASPAFPSTVWSKTHFWGRYMNVDFRVLMEAAKAELLTSVGKDTTFAA